MNTPVSGGSVQYSIDINTQAIIDAQAEIARLNQQLSGTQSSTNQANRGLNSTAESIENVSSSAIGGVSSITKLASAIASLIAIDQLTNFVLTTSQAIDAQKEFADSIGASYAEVQKLSYAAEMSGVSQEAFQKVLIKTTVAMNQVAKNAAPALSKQLKQLGVDAKAISLMPVEQQLKVLADASKNFKSEAELTTFAIQLFGEEGAKMTNFLRQGSEGIQTLTDDFERMGAVVSDDTANDFAAFNDALDNMNVKAGAVGAILASKLIPVLNTVSGVFEDVTVNAETVDDVLNGIGTAAYSLATVITAKLVSSFLAYVVSQQAALAATIRTTTALVAQAAAMGGLAAASAVAATGIRVLAAGMALLGGPVGIAIIAGIALSSYSNSAETAAEKSIRLAQKTDELNKSFKEISSDAINREIIKIAEEADKLNKELEEFGANQNIFERSGLGQKFTEDGKKIAEMRKQLQELYERRQILVNINVDRKSADETIKVAESVSKSIEEINSGKEFTLDDFVRAYNEAARASRSAIENIIRDRDELIKNVQKTGEEEKVAAQEIATAVNNIRANANKEAVAELNKNAKEMSDALQQATFFGGMTPLQQIEEKERIHIEKIREVYSKYPQFTAQMEAEITDVIKKNSVERQSVQLESQQKMLEARKKFDEVANSGRVLTPMQQTVIDEREALLELDALYKANPGIASLEEYESRKLQIKRDYGEQLKKLVEEERQTMLANASLIASAGADLFGNFADVLKQSEGEASSSYKTMFAISKGFAIAQAGLNLALAITNALASGPYPANLAAVASVAASGASFVSAVGSANYSGGRANGGPVSAGSSYRINESGVPEVYSYGNQDYLMSSKNANVQKLDDYMGGNSSPRITIINQTTGRIDSAEAISVTREEVVVLIKETVPSEIQNPNSKTSKALTSSTNSGRRIS